MKNKFSLIVIIPVLIASLYCGLKYGYINPMIKGVDIQIIGGSFITNINKYVIKVGDKVGLSAGDYVVVPAFSKEPELKFAVLDDSGVLAIEGNNLVAKKEGYSSIGILNKNRVLRKAAIMVVEPKIKNMQVELKTPLKYFGDKSEIDSSVNIDDYKKLEKGYKLNYSVSNPKVLKIDGDTVEAIGVGESKLISRYDRKEIQRSIKILPRVDKININKGYSVEEGQSMTLNPVVMTSPANQALPIEYKVYDSLQIYSGESGIQQSYGIRIDEKGKVYANRVGKYRVKVSCGNKSVKTMIEVKPKSFKNLEIRNLAYSINGEDADNIDINIGCDYSPRIDYYKVFIKSQFDDDFVLYKTIKANKSSILSGGRIVENIDFKKVPGYDYKIYIVGYNGIEETKKSNVIEISEEINNEFSSFIVKDFKYFVDEENSTISFAWERDKNGEYTYRIYSRNTVDKKSPYTLTAKNIHKDSTTIKVNSSHIDREYCIVAVNKYGQISNLSEPVRITGYFSE